MSASASSDSWSRTAATGAEHDWLRCATSKAAPARRHQQWYVTPGYWDVPEDSCWGSAEEAAWPGPLIAEEAAWPGPLIETTTTNSTNTSTTNMRGELTNTGTTTTTTTRVQHCRPNRGRHSSRWGRQLQPPKRDFTHRVTQFRRQDLKRKETGQERKARREGIPVWHEVSEYTAPFFVGVEPDLEM